MNAFERKRPTRKLYFLLLFLVLTGGAIGYFHYFEPETIKAYSPKALITTPHAGTAAQLKVMASDINTTISQNPDIDIGVSIINLKDNGEQQYGVTDAFEAASTAKLITAADFLHHVENGDYTLHDTINGADAEYELQQMIEVSDDDAWQAFNDTMGHPDLLSYASSIGLMNYDPDDNTLPANDIAILLEKLYEGKLLNRSDTSLLLNYMSQANYTQYMGAVVPSNVKFYHKAGVLDDRIHDAAIIDNEKNPIVLVVFTKNEADQNDASSDQTNIIQAITSDVLKAYDITQP